LNLEQRATKGVMWSGISQFLRQGFQFVIIAILAHLLSPEDFGIVGMALIFTGLAVAVNELGFGAAIIQRKKLDESHLSTSFWASLGMGIIIFITAVIVSPFVAGFFKKDIVASVLIVCSLAFLIGPFSLIHRSLLFKKLDFKKLAVVEIGATLISGISAVIMAFVGFGVWSLAWRGVIAALVTAVLIWIVSKWRPSMQFSLKSFKELFKFGGNVVGANFVNYFQANVDYMIVGRILGAPLLGLYTLAYRLITFPLDKISTVVTRVTFPTFSSIQDDNLRLRRGYLKTISYISLVTFPALAGLFIVAPEFVRIVFGEKWMPAVLPLQILCIVGMLKSIGTTVGSIQYAKGRPDIALKWDTFKLISIGICVFFGARYGIVGVAYAIAILTVVTFPIIQLITNSLINLSFREYLSSLYPATLGSGAMLLVLAVYCALLRTILYQNDAMVLISSIFLGITVYFAALKMAKIKELDEVIQIAAGIFKPYFQSIKGKVVLGMKNARNCGRSRYTK